METMTNHEHEYDGELIVIGDGPDALIMGVDNGPDRPPDTIVIGSGATLEQIRSAIDVSSRPPSDPDLK
ncbi:MAG: hypothetical protein JXR96_04890 [Deltaproteobacteria bacterium]|nr:hypothetical protein [Deltaproteobacteria bacterium]